MADFKPFALAVSKRFGVLSQHELFRVDLDGQALWDAYLAAFPEGTNPIYRVRTEHDGSYDRNVLRRIGNVVAVINGEIATLWNLPNLEEPYKTVAEELNALVARHAINGLFRINEKKLGHISTTEQLEDNSIKTWNHFHAEISERHFSRTVDADLGKARETADMFVRSYEAVNEEAIIQVLDLIDSNSLYRGSEFRAAVAGFQQLVVGYSQAKLLKQEDIMLWSKIISSPFARFKNTMIGNLVFALSEGTDIEEAVRMYESQAAPANYKRPTAVITQGMIKTAMQKINDLGLETALERRYARLADVSVNDVIWVNGQAATKMKDGIEGLLQEAVKPKAVKVVDTEEIDIEDFLKKIVPMAGNMEVLLHNGLQSNLVSITAPVHDDVVPLFKWNNNFAWSYNGEITDSIKEKVKRAGGNTDADLRVSLAWFNSDDLDLHSKSPYGYVYYGTKQGILDVDANGGFVSNAKDPVENQSFERPRDGNYEFWVNQYNRRGASNPGFVLQLECNGKMEMFSYEEKVTGNVRAFSFEMKGGALHNLKVNDHALKHTSVSQDIWGLKTEQYVKVSSIMLSPNHWGDNQTGNKHFFFILEGCANPEATRGIYNEFLRSDLEQHRKVFEVLGSKTKCPPNADQLSGVGFSSTKRDQVTIHVTGSKINKTYLVKF